MPIDLTTLKKLYPFDSHYFDVGGPRMHYVDEGEGRAVVMLHGNPTWSFYFRELIKELREDHRVVAPDHIGCGLSEKPQAYAYTLGRHVDNIEKLIDRLGLKDITLIVHDWGAAIGMGWVVRRPELVRDIVVLNGGAFFCGKAPWRIRICTAPFVGDVLIRGLNAFVRAACSMATARPERMTPDVKGGYLFPYGSWASRVAILGFVRDIPRNRQIPSHSVLTQIESRLPELRDRPMMICWGVKDFCFDKRFLEGWISRFPQARVHRFEEAGHYVLEDAHEHILPLVREFVKS